MLALDRCSMENRIDLDHEILSDEKIRSLVIAAQQGNQDATDLIIRHNQRLVYKIAAHNRYRAGPHTIHDLMQEGNIGLLEAIKRFDPSRQERFATYAYWWVRAKINRFCDQNEHPVHIPVKQAQILTKARHDRAKKRDFGERYEIEDESKKHKISPTDLSGLLQVCNPVSMDDDDDDNDKHEYLCGVDGIEDLVAANDLARRAIEKARLLPDRIRLPLLDYVGFGGKTYSIANLARKYEVSESVIQSYLSIGLKYLQRWLS